jgi:site-specific recombinase XerD
MTHPPAATRSTVPRGRRSLDADLLSRAEITALIGACPGSRAGVRNATLLTLAWRAGLRCSELLDLRVKDVDLVERALVVQHGKNDRRRIVGLDARTVETVGRWLRLRGHALQGDYLFPTAQGTRLDASYLRHLLPRLARSAGIHKRVHLHAFRHRYAIELESEGAPLSVIRDLLGHTSIATTDAYLRRAGGSRAAAFARERHWD